MAANTAQIQNPYCLVPGVYEHYKGARYLLTEIVVWHDGFGKNKPRYFVSYICLYANRDDEHIAEKCIRPAEEWLDDIRVGLRVLPRYKLIVPTTRP